MLITLTGPTAAGKSSIERELQKLGYGRAISHTTRSPRAGEMDAQAYHFVTPDEFGTLEAQGEFVELITFGVNRYAMSKAAIHAALAATGNAVIVVDPHGASQIRQFCLEEGIPVRSVWVSCSAQEQGRRWVQRLATDIVFAGVDKTVGPAAERLALMMTEEQQWVANARDGYIVSGFHSYDDFIWSTELTTPDRWARILLGIEERNVAA